MKHKSDSNDSPPWSMKHMGIHISVCISSFRTCLDNACWRSYRKMLSSVHVAAFRDFSSCFYTANVCSPCTSADVTSRSQDILTHSEYAVVHVVARTIHFLKKRSFATRFCSPVTKYCSCWNLCPLCCKKEVAKQYCVSVSLDAPNFSWGKCVNKTQRTRAVNESCMHEGNNPPRLT